MTDAADRIPGLPRRKNPRHAPGALRVYLAARKARFLRVLGKPGERRDLDWDAAAREVETDLKAEGKDQTVTGVQLRTTWWRICRPRGVAPTKKPKPVRQAKAPSPQAPTAFPPVVQFLRPVAPSPPEPPRDAAPRTSADEQIEAMRKTHAKRGHRLPRPVE